MVTPFNYLTHIFISSGKNFRVSSDKFYLQLCDGDISDNTFHIGGHILIFVQMGRHTAPDDPISPSLAEGSGKHHSKSRLPLTPDGTEADGVSPSARLMSRSKIVVFSYDYFPICLFQLNIYLS
jgi:hypothetical protein